MIKRMYKNTYVTKIRFIKTNHSLVNILKTKIKSYWNILYKNKS